MSYEHKNGNGNLFKNQNKTSESHPDYTGTIRLQDGKDQQIAAWLKDGKGGKFLSLKLSDPYKKPEPDDDMPF